MAIPVNVAFGAFGPSYHRPVATVSTIAEIRHLALATISTIAIACAMTREGRAREEGNGGGAAAAAEAIAW